MEETLLQLQKSKVMFFHSTSILLSLSFLFLFNNISIASSSASPPSYSDHCNSIVPESTPAGAEIFSFDFLQLRNAYFVGGNKILDDHTSQSSYFPRSLVFRTRRFQKTDKDDVFLVEGVLVFRGAGALPYYRNFTLAESRPSRFRTRRPRFPLRRGRLSFDLKGFWSESSGKLCMVGSGNGYSREGNLLDLSAVFKINNYPKNSTIFSSLVSGTLESLDAADSLNYFDLISLLAFSQRNYNYSLVSEGNVSGGCSSVAGGDDEESLNHGEDLCSVILGSSNGFELMYGSHCDSAKDCSPLGGSNGFLPGFMSFSGVQCSPDKKLRLLMGFSNRSNDGYYQNLVPNTTLIGEGVWDGEKNQLCVVACHILNSTESLVNAFIGDCSVRMRLRFPAIVTIKSRSNVVGQIWSNKTVNDSDHFDKIMFRSSADRILGIPGLKYKYTEIDRVRKLCAVKKAAGNKGKMYPSGYSYDMRFDMKIKNSQGKEAWGYSAPVSVGDEFYERSYAVVQDAIAPENPVQKNQSYSRLLNVSYAISFTLPADFELGGRLSSTYTSSNLSAPVRIMAEGVYDTETGSLCMVGCRYLVPNHQIPMQNDYLDCEILINVQFPPLSRKKATNVKGTIESTRKKSSDPLYFEHLDLYSIGMYTTEAVESVWRMDLEITMVLISNTFICIFVVLQLFYVKKHPDVLPSISLVMLVILTLGHMIPLVLNFEALFLTSRSRQNILTGSGGWLEVNEVIVRVVTMVAFLLLCRLLQLTWSSRFGDENQKGLWTAEKKVLCVLLPLYLLGGLIALIVVSWDHYYDASLPSGVYVALNQSHSLLGNLRAYAGLLLDGFLLPQILLNMFSSSKDKALSPALYVGITAVRLLPHAYDLYRAHSYSPYYGASYIYASPGGDFFSTAWDVIIPCGGLLFAILIYVQQRFGGHCILPHSLRGSSVYEKVPVTTGE